MPRLFFDIVDGRRLPDLLGVELQDLAAAQTHAIEIASTFIGQEPSEIWRDNAWAIGIRREGGGELCRLEINVSVSEIAD